MNYVTVTVGIAAIVYGLYNAVLRIRTPRKLAKLLAMQAALGKTPGSILHFFAYSVVPIIAGLSFIIGGLKGRVLFENY